MSEEIHDRCISIALSYLTTELSAFGGKSAIAMMAEDPSKDTLNFIRGTLSRMGFEITPHPGGDE